MKKIFCVIMTIFYSFASTLTSYATDVLLKRERLESGVVKETYQDGDVVTFYPQDYDDSKVFKEIVSPNGVIQTYYYPGFLEAYGKFKITYPYLGKDDDVEEILIEYSNKAYKKFFNGKVEEFKSSVPKVKNYKIPTNIPGRYDVLVDTVYGSITQDSIISSEVQCTYLCIEDDVTVTIKDTGRLVNTGNIVVHGTLINDGEFVNDSKCVVFHGTIENNNGLSNNGRIKNLGQIKNSGTITNKGKIINVYEKTYREFIVPKFFNSGNIFLESGGSFENFSKFNNTGTIRVIDGVFAQANYLHKSGIVDLSTSKKFKTGHLLMLANMEGQQLFRKKP